MNTFRNILVKFLFPAYVAQWESYANYLERVNVDLIYANTKTKRINDDLSIGMLPGFDMGTRGLVPVMDSEGNIALYDKYQVPNGEIESLDSVPVYESMPIPTITHDDTVKVITHDVMDYVLGRIPESEYLKSNGKNKTNKSNGSKDNGKSNGNGKAKNNGSKPNSDSGSFEPIDNSFYELVDLIMVDRGVDKLPKDQFNWLKDKYAAWSKNPADNAEYQKRFDGKFAK